MPTPAMTDAQCAEALRLVELHGSITEAALAEGISRGTLQSRVDTARKRARVGHAPGHFNSGVAPGYLMGKVTVQRNADGDVERTWERQSPEQLQALEAQRVAYEVLAAELPRIEPSPDVHNADKSLCSVYTLTDCHVGALAWHREGGADWDLEIAEKTLIGCFRHMIHSSPNSELGIVNQLGDFLHWDGLEAVTPTSRHLLDADGRFEKVVTVAIRILRRVVDLALEKHPKVHVILAEGNHDIASSVWLRQMFAALYENEPRVMVEQSPLPYYALEWGKTLLAFHHGHLKKNDQLPIMVATQFAEIWGRTTKRYCHTGHRHHLEEKEHSGMVVFQHPTLAARDAYAARWGWHAMRSATVVTYHKLYGEVGRATASPDMLQ